MRIQHGDLILEEVKKLPRGLFWKKVKQGFVIEKGEGAHLHTTVDDCEVAEKDGVLYLRSVDEHKLGVDHEEHHVKILDPEKIYRKGIELEYDAETDEARKTQD